MINQVYYISDLPAKSKWKVKVSLAGAKEGTYLLKIYEVGYLGNDAGTTYHPMDKPKQIIKEPDFRKND